MPIRFSIGAIIRIIGPPTCPDRIKCITVAWLFPMHSFGTLNPACRNSSAGCSFTSRIASCIVICGIFPAVLPASGCAGDGAPVCPCVPPNSLLNRGFGTCPRSLLLTDLLHAPNGFLQFVLHNLKFFLPDILRHVMLRVRVATFQP